MNHIRWTHTETVIGDSQSLIGKGTSGRAALEPCRQGSLFLHRTTVWSRRHRTNIVFSWTAVWNIITTSQLMLGHDTHLYCSYSCENPQRLNYLNELIFHDSLQRLHHLAPWEHICPTNFPHVFVVLCVPVAALEVFVHNGWRDVII